MKSRRFLEDEDLNEIARRRTDGDPDVFDLIFTVRRLRRDAEGERHPLMKPIANGLRDAIVAHGPITPQHIGSAAKRVCGRLRGIRY